MNKNLLLALSIGVILSGCASMMPERTTAVKRATETKEYDVSTKELITASIGTFQDLGYTIDVLNAEFGLITASKTQGTTTTRTNLEEDPFEAFFRALTGFEDNSDVIIDYSHFILIIISLSLFYGNGINFHCFIIITCIIVCPSK